MRKTPLFVAFSLLAAAGPAAPQAPKPAPAEERPAAPSPSPRLNLKLDDPARYTREVPRERGGSADALPTLGADARTLEQAPSSSGSRPSSPYPPDTTPGRY